MPLRLLGGRTINVIEVGAGRPVLFLHGNPLDHRDLLIGVDPLFAARSGYRRFHVDLPGFGSSPGDPAIRGSDGMLGAVLGIVDEIAAVEPILLVGASWGAYLARGVVARRPMSVAGVALLCPLIVASRTERDLDPHRLLIEEPGMLDGEPMDEATAFLEGAVVAGRPQWAHFRTAIATAMAAADSDAVARTEAAYAFAEDVDTIGEPYDGPALIVAGRQDATVGYRDALRLVDRYARSTFAVLDVAGHSLVVERPAVVASLISDWLDRVEADR
jgi:pimeloyl-ACP methyl ester carboxylesterase